MLNKINCSFFLESTFGQNTSAHVLGQNKEGNTVILDVSYFKVNLIIFQSYVKDFNIIELRHEFKNLKT